MNPDDEYQKWLNAKRAEVPPAELVERIMSAVRAETISYAVSHAAIEPTPSVWRRAVPYMVCSAAAIVLAVRLYSTMSLFVMPSSIADVTMIESKQENLHD